MPTVERIEPAYDGLNTDSAPDTLKTEAPLLENFLVDRPGKLPMRGPINGAVQIYSGAVAEKPVSTWVHNNNLLVARKANSATAVRDPWVAPFRRAAAESELSQGFATLYHLNLESGVTSELTATPQAQIPGPRSTRLGDIAWGIGLARATGAGNNFTSNGGIQFKTHLLRWDGIAAAPTAYSNGPMGAQDVRAHLNRLFAAGGLKPGTSTHSPNSLFFSVVGGPASDTLGQWQDPATGLVNELVVDSNDPSDYIVGLAKVGRSLAIFKRRSIHLLIGETSATFVLRPFTTETGCVDPRSILEYQDGVFFASDQGLVWFDGQQLINVTQDQRSTVVAAIANAVGNYGVDGGRAVCGRLPNDYIWFGVGSSPASVLPTAMAFSGIYHPPRTAWASLSSLALSGGKPIAAGRSLSKTFLVDDLKVIGADAITAPEAVEPQERGFDSESQLVTFENNGSLTFDGPGNAARNTLTGAVAFTSQVDYAIPSRWWSKLARLSQSMYASRLQRFAMDYTFKTVTGADGDVAGWNVRIVDGRGNELMATAALPSQGAASVHAYRRQFMRELFAEGDDAQLRVEAPSTVQALEEAAIFNSYLEFDQTHQRSSR